MKHSTLLQRLIGGLAGILLGCGGAHADLLAYYNGEEASPGPLVDIAGGQNAVEDGLGFLYAQPGPTGFGNAIGLTNNGSWQLTPTDAAELNLANDFTVAAWVYLDSTIDKTGTGVNTGNNRIIGDDAGWDADGWSFGIRNGSLLLTKNGVVDAFSSGGTVPTDQWIHVAVTASSTAGLTFYLDGAVHGTNGNTANNNTGLGNNGVEDPYGIGRTYGAGEGQWFAGNLDEVRVYDTVLSEAEIANLLTPPGDPNLIAPTSVTESGDGNAMQITIDISNSAGTTNDLVLTAPGLTGTNAANFVVNSFTTPVLADGGTGTIVLDFTPTGGGTYEATLTINSNDLLKPNYDVSITIDVNDPGIVIDPELSFGLFFAVPAATTGDINVENIGGLTTLTLSNPQITGAGAAAYMVTSLPAALTPGAGGTIQVTFDPGVGGDFPAVLSLDTNDPLNTVVTVDLSAEVRDPEIFIDASLAFGSFPANPGAQTGVITVQNFGEGTTLVVSNPQITGAGASAYVVTSLPGPIATNGGTDTVEVTFDPGLAGGSFPASLTLDTNDPFSPTVTVTLSAQVDAPIDLDGPSKVSHFTFDDAGNLGDDTGAFNNDGTVNGDATQSPVAAVGTGALLLDGDGDFIEVPVTGGAYTTLDDDGDGFTVAAWVCASSAGATGVQRIFSTYKPAGFSGNGFGVGFRYNGVNNDILATTYGVVDRYSAAQLAPPQEEWHHVTIVYRGNPISSVDYYVDGILGNTNAAGGTGMIDTAQNYAIGALGAPPAAFQWFAGYLDDMRIYSVELGEVDAANLTAMGTPGVKPGGPSVEVTSISRVDADTIRIEFLSSAANTAHEVKSSPDLAATPFAGAVTISNDGLTTDGSGSGFVEIDITVPGTMFYQVQLP